MKLFPHLVIFGAVLFFSPVIAKLPRSELLTYAACALIPCMVLLHGAKGKESTSGCLSVITAIGYFAMAVFLAALGEFKKP